MQIESIFIIISIWNFYVDNGGTFLVIHILNGW
jgi:hypothetical protein